MITVNGKETGLEAGITVSECLEANHYQIRRIAVELNGTIVPKSDYSSTVLKDGDKLEIVSFVGGG